jgi:imidazole glycerol-phosphate synthase subunit HisH
VSTVTLIDYGAGNLRSLRAAFERLGAAVRRTGDAAEVRSAERIVLPGVGAAAPAMEALEETGIADALRGARAPLLGVCLGMQLLFERSQEGGVAGLGLLPGRVERIDWAPQVPHMGWNDVVPSGDGAGASAALPAVCYFAHSYAVVAADPGCVVATTDIGGRDVPALVNAGNVTGMQFHPEKSGPGGRALLEAWLAA